MKIEITQNVTDNTYLAEVWDGPDGIDHANFLCSSLGECFEQIIKWQMINAFCYGEDT